MDYNKANEAFENFIKQFDIKDEKINIKYHHTYQVVRLMEKLAKYLHLESEKIELAKIIGLIHDLGRFIQIKKSGDFDDIITKIDHAKLGVKYLFEENHIRDFVEKDTYDNVIKNAILNHNRLTITKNLDELSLLFTKMIRDMDKVDIFRASAVYFEMELEEEDVSKEVLENFENKTLVDSFLIKTNSEKTLGILAFVFDINYQESYEILNDTDNLELFISSIEVPKSSEEFKDKIIEKVRKTVTEGLLEK